MLGDTFGITYNTVAKTLKKVNQDNFGATYYLEDGDDRFTVKVSHTIPATGKAGESHQVRLYVAHHDAISGDYVRTANAWISVKTTGNVQDSTKAGYATDALLGWATPANVALLIGRES